MHGFALFLFIFSIFTVPAQAQSEDEMALIAEQASACRQYITDRHPDWEVPVWQCREGVAKNLSRALIDAEEFRGSDNAGYTMGENNPACEAMREAGFPACNYNIRRTFVQFLALYGVDLFPSDRDSWPAPGTTSYSGTARQNAELVRQIERNAHLLADGELTAEEVNMHWN